MVARGTLRVYKYKNTNAILCRKCVGTDPGKQLMKPQSPSPKTVAAWSSKKALDADYRTGIGVAETVSATGWIMVAIAIFSVFDSVVRDFSALALASSLGLIVCGFVLVVAGQSSRALMDTANTSKKILEEIKKLNTKGT